MLEALLDKIETYGFTCEAGPLTGCVDWQKLRVACLLAAEPHGEPVAWAVPDKWHPELLGECTFDLGTAKDWKRRGEVLTPLYLHPTPDAQPVAWMWQHDETGRVGFVDQWQLDNGWEKNNPRCHITRPLFDHPAPAQTPLTEDEILKLWDSRWLEHPLLDGNELTLAFVRAVERAHGIGAKA